MLGVYQDSGRSLERTADLEGVMEIYLETERLILRRFTADDTDKLVALDSDPEVMRFLNGGTPTPREAIEGRILPGFLRSYEQAPGFGVWAAIQKASGDFLGWLSLRPPDGGSADDVSLGYRLRRAAWGQGYATEGARALIRKGFTELGVRRVYATTYEYNLVSRRVMEKAGLTLVRRFRFSAAELSHAPTYESASQEEWEGDEVEYALLKVDWERVEEARN
jgi:RimJ/RimL family protein N-acetyltransferase